MLKEICFIKTVLFLFALPVSSSDDYKLPKEKFLAGNSHTKNTFNKHLDFFLQQTIYDGDHSVKIGPKQRNYNELLKKLRMMLTLTLTNPKYVIYLTNISMPVYNIDLKLAQDSKSENFSLKLRRLANSGKKINKKASDSSESSELSDANGKDNLRYDSCKRGRKKCVKACKSSYREVCYYQICWPFVRRRLRKYCKKSCRKWFT